MMKYAFVAVACLALSGCSWLGEFALELEDGMIERTKTAGATVLTNAIIYAEQNQETPDISDLLNNGFIIEAQANDPWHNRYVIAGVGADIHVISAGPDGAMSTNDDIKIGGSP